MDTSRQLPTHGDGLLDMRELARTLLESMVNKVMDAQADMLCEDGANSRNGYRERGLPPRRRHHPAHTQAEGRDPLPRVPVRALLARRQGRRGGRRGVVGQRRVDEEDGADRRKMGTERLSKDQVSTMCRSLDAEVGELAARGLRVPAGRRLAARRRPPRARRLLPAALQAP